MLIRENTRIFPREEGRGSFVTTNGDPARMRWRSKRSDMEQKSSKEARPTVAFMLQYRRVEAYKQRLGDWACAQRAPGIAW